MTYEEAYRQCKTVEELLKMVNRDMAFAAVINRDRIPVIRKMAEKVLNEKFPEYEVKQQKKIFEL